MITQEITLKKSQILDSFRDLPEDVTAEVLIERILFVKLIQERIKESEESKGMPHEEFMREFDIFKAQKRAESQLISA
jgi:hypothetical protein